MSVEIKKNFEPEDPCEKGDHEKEMCCVCRTIKFIHYLQKKSVQEDCCVSCLSPVLGATLETPVNTRPFSLYTICGTFTVNIYVNGQFRDVTRFRVEDVHDCCATLRPLYLDTTSQVYTPVDHCVIVELCQFIGILCYPDITITCS